MEIITEPDLNYIYNWSEIDAADAKITGSIDETSFDRNEGYEVLYLVNRLCADFKLKNATSALKMEKMIKEYLPLSIQTQIDVKKWIYQNWKKF